MKQQTALRQSPSCAIAAAALAAAVLCPIRVLVAEPLPPDMLAVVTAPKMSRPPVIDGIIGEEEWREAAAISGLAQQNPGGNLLIMRPTTYYLAWDADNLYIACRTWLMPGYKPRVENREPNTASAFDDGMEFNLKPCGRNVAEGRADSSYKFFITCAGSDGDFARVSVGQLFRNWMPNFPRAWRITPPGSAPLGGSWWECEVVLPAKEFELTGPNRAGDTWRMLLAFNHIPGWMQAAIPLNSGYFDPSGFPTVVLSDDVPAVQVTMDELPGPKDGVAAVVFRIFNPTAKEARLKISARFSEFVPKQDSKDKQDEVELLARENETIVAPGRTAEFRINEKFPRDIGGNKSSIFYRVVQQTDRGEQREIFRYYVYFRAGYEEKWVKCQPMKEAFPLSCTFNPVRDSLRIVADAHYLDDPQSARKVSYTVRRQKDQAPVAEGSITNMRYDSFSSIIRFPEELGEGEYTVSAVIERANGERLGPVETTFRKLDPAQAFQSWWKNGIGDVERPIPPFTGVSSSGNTARVIGREYIFDRLGLPARIVSGGRSVLSSAAYVSVIVGGREYRADASGAPEIAVNSPWRCSFNGSAEAAGLRFSSSGIIEQDGMVSIHLTFGPAGDKPVQFDALRIEFPLDAENAEGLLCIGPGGNFSSLTHMLIPRSGEGRVWSTLDTGRGGSSMAVGSFYPDVWIGNERCGLLWWSDSDYGWVPDDEVPAHEVFRRKGEVVLRNNIIGKPFELRSPRTINIVYMASPFKPLPKGWRMAIHSEDGTFTGPHKVRTDPKTGRQIDGWCWLCPPSTDPAEWSALWTEYKQQADAAAMKWQPFDPARARNHTGSPYLHTSLPLTGYGVQTSDRLVASYFAPEWDRGNFNSTMRDYLLWLADRAFREGGLRTIYWDICYVTSFKAPQAGFGYELPDGRIQPSFHGHNLRRFMMRMYALMQERGLTPGSQVVHSSNAYPLLAFPWIDAALDGEWAQITDATTRDWVDFYPIERMRVMSCPHNFGTVISWMSLIHVQDRERYNRIFRGFIDYQRLHDTWTGQDGRYPPDSILEWGLNDERLVYIPYWRNMAVTCPDRDVLVSAWTAPDRAILIAFNYSNRETKSPVLSLNLKELGIAPKSRWPGAVVCKEIGSSILAGNSAYGKDPDVIFDPAGNTVAVPGLLPHTGRYIGIRMQEKDDVERLLSSLREAMPQMGMPKPESVPEDLLDWGLAGPDLRYHPLGSAPAVKPADQSIRLALWQRPDRILLAVFNSSESMMKEAVVAVDLAALKLKPELPWQEFVRVREFWPENPKDNKNIPELDYYGQKLILRALPAGKARFVAIRRY